MTDKITFNVDGERHDLPIDSSKTLRVGDASPETKLTVTSSFNPPLKIVLMPQASGGPIMTIHPDGKITLGENAEPTEAAAECIEAMSHMIQSMIRKAAADERAAIVAYLRIKRGAMQHIADDLANVIEAGKHLK